MFPTDHKSPEDRAAEIAVALLRHEAEQRARVRAHNGFHSFGRDRRCSCGIAAREYHAGSIEQRSEPCINFTI